MTVASDPESSVLRVLVAEDEPVPRRRLARLLAEVPGVQVIAQCSGGREAVQRIREEHPDVAFLDVQMPDLDGFGVIETVGPEHMPLVVFVTAFDAHAVRAFDVHAADYLLKPYDADRLRTAVARVRERLRVDESDGGAARGAPEVDNTARLRELLRGLARLSADDGAAPRPLDGASAAGAPAAAPAYPEHVAVRTDTGVRIVRTTDVDWFQTEGNYVRVHVGKESYLLRQTAAMLERELDPRQFTRIHRRYIVNVRRVYEVQPWFGGDAVIVLRDGRQLRLSRTYREQFLSRFLGDASEQGRTRAGER